MTMEYSKEFERETGQKAMYRKGASDYHTLQYVRWLEGKLAARQGDDKLQRAIDEVFEEWDRLSQDEFEAELERHKDHPLTRMLLHATEAMRPTDTQPQDSPNDMEGDSGPLPGVSFDYTTERSMRITKVPNVLSEEQSNEPPRCDRIVTVSYDFGTSSASYETRCDAKMVKIDGEEATLNDDDVVIIPAGTEHYVKNTGDGELKLYSIYAEPEHPPETIHKTKEEADAAEHHH